MRLLKLPILLSSFFTLTPWGVAAPIEDDQNPRKLVLRQIGVNHSSHIEVRNMKTGEIIPGQKNPLSRPSVDLKAAASEGEAVQILANLLKDGIKITTPPKKRGRSNAMLAAEKRPMSIEKTIKKNS